jgi:hypothetical protein
MPLGLYAKHESEILQQPSGLADDITQTKAFRLLRDDTDSRLIINCEYFLRFLWGPANKIQFMEYD